MESPRPTHVYVVDLDNTIYNQDHYDCAVISKSVHKYNALDFPCQISGDLTRRLVEARLRDRRSRNLFDSVLIPLGFTGEMIHAFVTAYLEAASYINITLTPYQGCLQCLDFLRQDNARILLVTNGKRDAQLNKLRCLGVDELFDRIIVLDGRDGRELKPSGKYVLKCLANEERDLCPQYFAVIGDDLIADMGLAKEIGCRYYHPSQLWSRA